MSVRPALLGLLLPCCWLVAGCGGGVTHSASDTPNSSAGSAGSAGPDGSPGSAGSAGVGDSAGASSSAGAGSTKEDRCAVQPLSTFCYTPDRCPTGPDNVTLNCDASSTHSTRSATICGGSVVDVGITLVGSSWYFDADGQLVGLRILSDTGPICYDEFGITTYGVTTYGEVCGALGEAEDLCQATCTDQPPLTEDGAILTEDSFDFLSHCSEAATQVIRSTTICGGTLYLIRRDEYGTSEDYCFDEKGRLIGSYNPNDEGAPAPRGARCKPTEPEEYLCATKL